MKPGKEIAEYPSWRELLECMTIQKGETTADKKVLIIENFQYLLKGDTFVFAGTDPVPEGEKRGTVSDPDHPCLRLGGEQHDFQSGKSGIFRQRISEGEGTLPFAAMRKIFPTIQYRKVFRFMRHWEGCRDCGGCFIRRIRQKKI